MASYITAVLSEAWAKLREWAILAGKGRLLLSGSVVLASLKAAVTTLCNSSYAKHLLVQYMHDYAMEYNQLLC